MQNMTETQLSTEFIKEMINHYLILKEKAEKAFYQLSDDSHFDWQPDPDTNSVGIIIRHLAGNMKSRWADFLTTDGEKDTRKRDDEFDERIKLPKHELLKLWEDGWKVTFETINNLESKDMMKIVKIRGVEHSVVQALFRQLTHYAEHVGQIYFICKMLTKQEWKSLTRPKKQH